MPRIIFDNTKTKKKNVMTRRLDQSILSRLETKPGLVLKQLFDHTASSFIHDGQDLTISMMYSLMAPTDFETWRLTKSYETPIMALDSSHTSNNNYSNQ